MNNDGWQQEIKAIYHDLQQGFDISPARVLHLEGRLALLLADSRLSWYSIREQIEQLYVEFFKVQVSPLHWRWCEDDGVFRLPYQMQVAPVTVR